MLVNMRARDLRTIGSAYYFSKCYKTHHYFIAFRLAIVVNLVGCTAAHPCKYLVGNKGP